MASQSFSLFPRLPTEIRLKIWQLALPPPRIIELYSIPSTPTSLPTFKPVPCDCLANCDIYPAIAAVNRESRSLFLSKFVFCFGTHVCWKQDTIYIHELDLQGSLTVVAGLRDFLATVKAFTDAVLGTRGGEDLASLALGVTSRWWPAWYCWDDVEVDQQDYGSPASMFERFTNIKELLLVNGTVGFFEVDQKTPTRSPGYKLAQHPITPFLRPGTDSTRPIMNGRNGQLYRRNLGGIQFVEAKDTKETVFYGDPTFVAEDFVNQMFEDELKGKVKIRAGVPPIRVVALRVLMIRALRMGQRRLMRTTCSWEGGINLFFKQI
jgi:hypothetical protein